MKNINLEIDNELHKKFKSKCVTLEVNMYSQLLKLIEEFTNAKK